MKAFLMFRDQDFNPKEPIPANSSDLIHDLELGVVVDAMALGDRFLADIAKQVLLSSVQDVETILYRQEILKDCLNNLSAFRKLYQIPLEATERRRKRWLGIFTHSPGGVLSTAVELMSMFLELLRQLRGISDEHGDSFHSEGFKRFFEMINKELDEEYFSTVEYHLKRLKFREGVLISAELGKGCEGENYTLRLPESKDNNWIKDLFSKKTPMYGFYIGERDDAGARAVEELKNIGINAVANSLAQSTEHIGNFLDMLQNELAFYLGCINLKEQLESLGSPISYPIPYAVGERTLSFSDMYDVSLALTMKKKVVGNDLDINSKELVIITGANQGGKSTFLRSIGLSQLMLQAGMFVPAKEFNASIHQGVFTHYKRKEDASMKSGKLDEELGRMSVIVDQLNSNALMLFNESFAATNEREGSEIARQITSALLEKEVTVFFVTHLFEFARAFYKKGMKEALFLRAERMPNGERTFKLLRGKPLPTSFGEDVYKTVFGKPIENSVLDADLSINPTL